MKSYLLHSTARWGAGCVRLPLANRLRSPKPRPYHKYFWREGIPTTFVRGWLRARWSRESSWEKVVAKPPEGPAPAGSRAGKPLGCQGEGAVFLRLVSEAVGSAAQVVWGICTRPKSASRERKRLFSLSPFSSDLRLLNN